MATELPSQEKPINFTKGIILSSPDTLQYPVHNPTFLKTVGKLVGPFPKGQWTSFLNIALPLAYAQMSLDMLPERQGHFQPDTRIEQYIALVLSNRLSPFRAMLTYRDEQRYGAFLERNMGKTALLVHVDPRRENPAISQDGYMDKIRAEVFKWDVEPVFIGRWLVGVSPDTHDLDIARNALRDEPYEDPDIPLHISIGTLTSERVTLIEDEWLRETMMRNLHDSPQGIILNGNMLTSNAEIISGMVEDRTIHMQDVSLPHELESVAFSKMPSPTLSMGDKALLVTAGVAAVAIQQLGRKIMRGKS